MKELPQKYNYRDSENKWATKWEEAEVYKWDENRGREETFVVDTPPPTVSGSLHIGHVFSYTHTDIVVRYQRMKGKNIMYPIGWDDNGLPTERRVENKYNIRCRPAVPFDPKWTVANAKGTEKEPEGVSRRNFIDACGVVTQQDEAAFEDLWRHLGLSVEWKQTYATIDQHCIKTSQVSFLDLVDKGLVYNAESPTLWDFRFQSAVSQAELEDRNTVGAFHDLAFEVEGGGEFIISTTRPELLVACVCVVAHPDDKRYQSLFGKYAITPVFGARVPILPAEHADPEKGTGILMVCTFGDVYDVEYWKKSNLPMKQVVGRDGRMLDVEIGSAPFESVRPDKAKSAYSQIKGKYLKAARKIMVEILKEKGSGPKGEGTALRGQPKTIEHPVKYYEKGDEPVEYVATRQWFIDILNHKKEMLDQGRKINWYPSYMRGRYESWVDGISHDWCISRQRYFGVAFPVWYPLHEDGTTDYENPIFASREMLPVDPMSQAAPGYDESQRGKAGGFTGDPDVMDTWATSSLTPQVVSRWTDNQARHEKLFPTDMRPQAHDIIRTWAFYTIYKAWMHEREIPWKNIVISGFIVDPDRKKMSKSKGNTVTPQHLLDQYSSDGVRYWAGRARLGVDTIFDESIFKLGQKLITKLFNAGRFVLTQIDTYVAEHKEVPGVECITEEVDRAFIEKMRTVIGYSSEQFEQYEFAGALQSIESMFWYFCDQYIELVKGRSYDAANIDGYKSAIATLSWSLGAFIRLFAPTVPFVCEELWQVYAPGDDAFSSVHKAPWPNVSEVEKVRKPKSEFLLDAVVEIIENVRGAKSEKQKTLKWPVDALEITASDADADALKDALTDIRRVGKVSEDGIILSSGDVASGRRVDVKVTLASEYNE